VSNERVVLLHLKIPGVVEPLRYQSYQLADYLWDGFTWSYAPFEVKSQPEQSLELVAENAQIWIQNSTVIRSMIKRYDGLRRSAAAVFFVDPTGEVPTRLLRLQVASSSPIGGYYVFNLATPTDARSGLAVNSFFSKQIFPEIPSRRATL
jgi:hypothetical protein